MKKDKDKHGGNDDGEPDRFEDVLACPECDSHAMLDPRLLTAIMRDAQRRGPSDTRIVVCTSCWSWLMAAPGSLVLLPERPEGCDEMVFEWIRRAVGFFGNVPQILQGLGKIDTDVNALREDVARLIELHRHPKPEKTGRLVVTFGLVHKKEG